MHKSKGQRAALASARTNKMRKRNELKDRKLDPAVQRKFFPPPPKPKSSFLSSLNPSQKDSAAYGFDRTSMAMMGAAGIAGATNRLPAGFDSALTLLGFGDPEDPLEVFEIDLTGDLSGLRRRLSELKARQKEGSVVVIGGSHPQSPDTDVFLKFVDQINGRQSR